MALASLIDEAEAIVSEANTLKFGFNLLSFLTKKNVSQIAQVGRARWKIENENNNTLRTKGYHLEHNFGHGKKYLLGFLMTLNILAFLFHTVLEHLDENYAKARVEFFNSIELLTRLIYFDSWWSLMKFLTRDRVHH